MAWHRPGDKPLSEPMMARLLTHICITLPQWVKKKNNNSAFLLLDVYVIYAYGCICMGVNASFSNRNVHMCTFLLQNGALWDICLMHYGICEMGLLCTWFILSLLWLVTGRFYPYPSGLLRLHRDMPVKEPWRRWRNKSCESTRYDANSPKINKTNTKPSPYFIWNSTNCRYKSTSTLFASENIIRIDRSPFFPHCRN